MEFYNFQTKIKSKDISLIFPDWAENDERLVIFSPHDDDVILGAGYLIAAALKNKSEIYIIIFNDGSAGYSQPELKNKIVDIRKIETEKALKVLGIDENKILRFDLPDFTGIHYLGWKLPWIKNDNKKDEGLFSKVVEVLRKIKATRLVFPNGYREHIDHTAVCLSAMFDGPQAGDSVIIDYGEPVQIKTYLQYCVWGKLSPEDALINKRDIEIRANRAVVVEKDIEQKIINSLMEFKTQQDIISNILEIRKERLLENSEKFIEVYMEVDPRPQFNNTPYKRLVNEIDKEK